MQAEENPLWDKILLEAMLPGYMDHDTELHCENPDFFFFFPHQEYILVWVCVGAEPPTSSWQKLRPVSMPIVYRGLHHDSYLALHWSHFDFSPLNRSPSQLRLAKQMKRKKEKEQKKPLIIFNAV